MYAPLNASKNNTIYEAVSEWNNVHEKQDRFLSDEKTTAKLAKTIFVTYSDAKGYSIEKIGKGKPWLAALARFFRWMHLGYGDTRLDAKHKAEVVEFKRTLKLASSPLAAATDEKAVKIARLKIVYGPEFTEAYTTIMDPNADATNETIKKLMPKIKKITDAAELRRYSFVRFQRTEAEQETFVDLEIFKAKTRKITDQYVDLQKGKIRDKIMKEVEELKQKTREQKASPAEIQRYKLLMTAIETRNLFISFYGKLLDSVPFDLRIFGGLSGYSSFLAIMNFWEDVGDFLNENAKLLTHKEKVALLNAMKDLQFAFDVAYEDDPNKAKELILKKLEGLSRPIIIAGGTKHHAVLYKIEMTGTGYRFSVIDTGAAITQIKFIVKWQHEVFKVPDLVFSDIPSDKLSSEFFEKLNALSHNAKQMREVYSFLEDELVTKGGAKKGESEEVRYLQTKGSCTVKVITEWLRTTLGKELFREFNAWMSNKTVKDIRKAAEDISSEALQWIFPGIEPEEETKEFYTEQIDALIQAGEDVSKRRTAKAKRIKPMNITI